MLSKLFPKQGETVPEIRFKGFSGDWEEQTFEYIYTYHRPDKYIVKSDQYNNKYNCSTGCGEQRVLPQVGVLAPTPIPASLWGRQGVNPASGETEAVALVALPSPHVYQGAAPDGVMHGGARRRGGDVWCSAIQSTTWGRRRGGASGAPTILPVSRCTVGREPERVGEGEGGEGGGGRRGG